MKRLVIVATVFLTVMVSAVAADGHQTETSEVAVGDLVNDPRLWDNRVVSITGELVGDYSRRTDGVWVQINEDPYVESPIAAGGAPVGANTGVGARIPTEVFEATVEGPPGHYGRVGPEVRLTGVFRHNDPELTGETYLDVQTIELVAAARTYLVAAFAGR